MWRDGRAVIQVERRKQVNSQSSTEPRVRARACESALRDAAETPMKEARRTSDCCRARGAHDRNWLDQRRPRSFSLRRRTSARARAPASDLRERRREELLGERESGGDVRGKMQRDGPDGPSGSNAAAARLMLGMHLSRGPSSPPPLAPPFALRSAARSAELRPRVMPARSGTSL
ncbi:hypothetical protein HPB50_020177 [Hyalomma asiaticum]|uniref:Uncharacterized protein n=1 Tax=Hyalomma asiaticum TaxID=266040 RepID=A0ACB7TKL3_HYAAI|nr:hypothetical protein HPB50_020177 [Hyalomma asiaticum]